MKIRAFLVITFLLPIILYGQGYDEYKYHRITPNIKSPTATSLCSFVNFPTSNYTGKVDINVPLWIMKGKSIEIPINLNYNSSGVMPENKPGWVGQNWSLLSGGVITRQTKDSPDEFKRGGDSNDGFYYLGNRFMNDYYFSTSPPYQGIIFDPEADFFNFNVLGKTGTFFYNQRGEWIVQSEHRFIVEKIPDIESIKSPAEYFGSTYYNKIYPSFYKFILKDDEGNQFIFGSSFDAIEYSCNIQDKSGESITPNAWYLSKIITHNSQDVVNFEYERGPFLCNLSKIANYGYCTGKASEYNNWFYTGTFISPVYLSSISINNGENIKFYSNKSYQLEFPFSLIQEASMINGSSYAEQYAFLKATNLNIPNFQKPGQALISNNPLSKIRSLRLDSLKIFNSEGKNIQNVLLNYNCTPTDTTKRLFLDKVMVLCQNKKGEEYSFLYYNRDLLPNYLSTITDHWGYNNNKSYPSVIGNNEIFTSRNSDSTTVKYGALIQIKYPTGGVINYEYDINTATKYIRKDRIYDVFSPVNISMLVGGIRIKKVTMLPTIGVKYEKRYIYQNNIYERLFSNGIGVLIQQENDISKSSGILSNYPLYLNTATRGSTSLGNIKSSPQLPLTSYNYENIGYSEVGELFYVNEKFSGAKVSMFTNHISNNDTIVHHDLNVIVSKSFERGKLLKEIMIDSLYSIKRELTFKYKRHNFSTLTTDNRNVQYSFIGVSNVQTPETWDKYSEVYSLSQRLGYLNYSYKYLLSSKSNREYLKGQIFETTEEYNYDTHNVLKSIKTSRSNGALTYVRNTHPQDYSNLIIQSPEVAALSVLNLNRCYAFPVEQSIFNINNNDTTLISSKLFTYKLNGDYVNKSKYYEFYNSILLNTPLSNILYPKKDQYELIETYEYEPNHNSLSQIKYRGNKSDLYYWSNKGMNPFLIIKNIDTTKVNLINKYSYFYNLYNSVLKNYEVDYYHNKLINDSDFKDCQIESYYFEPSVGLAQSSDSKGVKRYYQYDNLGRLICVRDNNRNILERYAYHYQNGSTPEALQIPENNIGAKLTCTLSGNGTLGNNNSLLRVGDAINLGVIFPVTPSQYYEFDGYYVNGVMIPNPAIYIVQGDVQIEARTKEVAGAELIIRFGESLLMETSIDYAIKQNGELISGGRINAANEPSASVMTRSLNYPIQISLITQVTVPSLKITIDGIVIFESMGQVPSGHVIEHQFTEFGPHEIVIEIP